MCMYSNACQVCIYNYNVCVGVCVRVCVCDAYKLYKKYIHVLAINKKGQQFLQKPNNLGL